ncbi:unnamed protein product [Phytomonas sp. Hart1]|nr:unnamed protein product [Phytomonas sp. Hart1]|eukprot:CCW72139.1 unnamed protein product [Phytomonas sp. isolate Hart1]
MEDKKDEARIQQEESDAILARHLQEEFDKLNEANAMHNVESNNTAQCSESPQKSLSNEVLTVPCPECTFNNNISNPVSGKHYACEQCYTQLLVPNSSSKEQEPPQIIECSVCHVKNIIPSKKVDALLCGACYQQLADPTTAISEDSTKEKRSVQIRCGQCSAINLVQVASNANVIQFECGGCQSINEVSLS